MSDDGYRFQLGIDYALGFAEPPRPASAEVRGIASGASITLTVSVREGATKRWLACDMPRVTYQTAPTGGVPWFLALAASRDGGVMIRYVYVAEDELRPITAAALRARLEAARASDAWGVALPLPRPRGETT